MYFSRSMGLDISGAPDTPVPSSADLLCCGQFMLGPSYPKQLSGWTPYPITRDLWLAAHPLLSVTRAADAVHTLTLVGYMLDPANPGADDGAILERLLPSCDSVRLLAADTAFLGGRWVLIAACADGLYLLTDALGLRQVFFTAPDASGHVWAMSQPGLAVDVIGLDFDEQTLQFIDSYAFRASPEYRWPGARTPLKGLHHLLPNHLLDFRAGKARRYWPDRELPLLSVDKALARVTSILTGMMRAAADRFDLALSLTAGMDSRLVLAAAREVKDRLCYITVRQARMADNNADLHVPARLLAKLNLPHEIIRARASMSPAFSWVYKRGVLLAHDHYGADAEAILAHFGRRKVAVTGSGAEVGRCSFRKELRFSDHRRIGARDLASLQRMNHPYAVECFAEWLEDAAERADVKLLDLFEWEQGHGNWLAMTQLEFDIAWRDIFTPYNCRTLLTTLLAVDERFRRAPDYTLFNLAIRKLWPELLTEPINPGSRNTAVARYLNLLRHGLHLRPRPA